MFSLRAFERGAVHVHIPDLEHSTATDRNLLLVTQEEKDRHTKQKKEQEERAAKEKQERRESHAANRADKEAAAASPQPLGK